MIKPPRVSDVNQLTLINSLQCFPQSIFQTLLLINTTICKKQYAESIFLTMLKQRILERQS